MREIHKAYDLIGRTGLGDIHSVGYILRHRKSGAHLALVENSDDNKVFYVGFRTPPEDSTGVAHIIEHSVLCGSDKYPAKDPFVELVKGSLNTFLNAMTYPDKTVYPVASCNPVDFANLMDVYLDAVFHPNIYARPEIFKQEGWHYEMDDPNGEITINGVVYNEMKGAFSSPDDVLSREILNSLFPDNAYGVESGGDPKNIPDLTYDQFLDFHSRYYHPCNSFIYLYGDMDMNERLDYLDREYLSYFEAIELDSVIRPQEPFETKRNVKKAYPVAVGEDTAHKTFLSLNYVVGTSLDPMLYQAFDILDYALLSSPGAPIRKALYDAGIGEDITGGYDASVMQPFFSFTVKGTDEEKKEEFEEIVQRVLREQVENGIDGKALLAAINGTEFKFREADFGSYPKGLIYGLNMLDSWLYDEHQPFLHMQPLTVLADLRNKIDTGYYEDLIERYFLSNTHSSLVVVSPEEGLAAKDDNMLRERLKEYADSLSEEEKLSLISDTKHLKAYQDEPSTEEELKKIPLLEREDLTKDARPIHFTPYDIEGINVVHHNIETSGIHYLEAIFDVSDLTTEEAGLFSLGLRLLGNVDTEEYTYNDLSNEINLYTGGMTADIAIATKADGKYMLYTAANLKFLYENTDKALHLLEQMLLHSSFEDKKRIREILFEEKSHMNRKIMTAGNTIAMLRATASFSSSGVIKDAIGGYAYYETVRDICDDYDNKADEFIAKVKALMERAFVPERMTISTAGNETVLDEVRNRVASIRAKLYKNGAPAEPVYAVPSPHNEGLYSAAKVNYVCRAGSFADAGYEYKGAMHILRVILSYDYLWQNVRVKGGAYGCHSFFTRHGVVAFTSYRDPNLLETKEIFEKVADYLENFDVSERDMTKYVIGTISSMDTPLTPQMDASRSFHSYLTGVSYELLQKEREEVIKATPEDIRALAPVIRDALASGYFTVVGGQEAIENAKDSFDEIRSIG